MRQLTDEQHCSPDILNIIEKQAVTPVFQQIVSVGRKTVCGAEGLIRGVDTATGNLISPGLLFSAAKRSNVTLELDRLCREKVLESFGKNCIPCRDKLLFLNMDTSVLDNAVGSNYLMQQVERCGVSPGNIVIEINESKVLDKNLLRQFIETYRDLGFLIALDDVGTGFSNLDRIPLVKPDIIKIDISLVRHIHRSYHKQEVFKALVGLAAQIGALVVAEGVETQDEAIQVLKLGANMIQGYYFCKPQPLGDGHSLFCNDKIELLGCRFKECMMQNIRSEKQKQSMMADIVDSALVNITSCSGFDEALAAIVRGEGIECAYVLNEAGTQCSNTVFVSEDSNAKQNMIFYSASAGADHSLKKYYYRLMNEGHDRYMTAPYVSLATGNLCVTFSKTFRNAEGRAFVLCVDFIAGEGADEETCGVCSR